MIVQFDDLLTVSGVSFFMGYYFLLNNFFPQASFWEVSWQTFYVMATITKKLWTWMFG